MKQFFCPYCNHALSQLDGTVLQLSGRLESDTFAVTTTFYIPAALGQYGAIVEGDVTLRDGAIVDFLCPSCQRSFTTQYDDSLAEVKMIDEEGQEFVVVFHRTYGQHQTYVIDYRRHQLTAIYGEDAEPLLFSDEKRVNFFGE